MDIVTELFSQSPWPGVALWMALYISDYAFTIACARMYRAQDKIAYEGSFEITPFYQSDVNALRRLSPKFVLALVLSAGLLWLVWQQAVRAGSPMIYSVLLGALILSELAVHTRHLRNWFFFANILGGDGVQGRVTYPRSVILRASAIELWSFAGLYGVIFAMTASWFVLGGVLKCSALALSHGKLARREVKSAMRAAASHEATST